jgi:hypothetical protein
MNTQPIQNSEKPRLAKGIVAGGILVIIGLLSLVFRLANFPPLSYPLILGAVFLAWGLLTRTTGLLIPGGILCGIFAGASLLEGPFANASDPSRGGIFLAAFAGGWVLISLLSLYTEGMHKWWSWPLYPAAALGLVATALLAGESGLKVLEMAGYLWPVVLIAIGIYLVLRRK